MFEKMGEQVKAFKEKIIGIKLPTEIGLKDADRAMFIANHNAEEIDELKQAIREGDIEEVVDAHIDNIYISIGALLELGALPRLHFDEVHLKNMMRVRGTKSTRPDSGGFDAIKPEGWTPPDHMAILEEMEVRMKVCDSFMRATKLKIERGKDYNAGGVTLQEHFPLGLASYFQMCWTKAVRFKALMLDGRKATDRALKDSVLDNLNYFAFAEQFIHDEEQKEKI